MQKITKQIRVYGIVQGVGFRPTVSRHGATSGVTGTVCNHGPFVEIFAQGLPEQVGLFEQLLSEQPPKRAAILKIDSKPLEEAPEYTEFDIIESAKTSGEIFISPDIATCDECKQEIRIRRTGDSVIRSSTVLAVVRD
ncbi:MAG: acylphosphatase [Lachnospiraceae bacterium]|nr:acylphosphatase [Lachnospiraceae bacterium]